MLSLYRILALVSIAALGAGATHLARYGRRRGGTTPPLQTWEAEGGAVPVGASRTAAQVTPRASEHAPIEPSGQQLH